MQFKNILVCIQLSIHNRNAPLGRDAAIQVISLSMTLSSLRQDFIQRRFRRRLELLCLHLAPATVGLAMMFLEHCLQDVLSLILGRFLPLFDVWPSSLSTKQLDACQTSSLLSLVWRPSQTVWHWPVSRPHPYGPGDPSKFESPVVLDEGLVWQTWTQCSATPLLSPVVPGSCGQQETVAADGNGGQNGQMDYYHGKM